MSAGTVGPEVDSIAPTCPICRMTVPDDASFCPHCGARLRGAPPPPPRYVPIDSSPTLLDVGRGVGSYNALILTILITLNIGIILASLGLVLSELEGYSFPLFLVTPWIVELVEISGTALAVYYLFLVVAIAGSFLWMMRKSLVPLANELRLRADPGRHSPAYVMATLFFSVVAFNFFYYLILGAGGIEPETPGFGGASVWEMVFLFANASVWEEIITRVLLIGVPLLFVDLVRRGRKRWWSYLLGGGFSLGRVELGLLIFSSAMFSLAHLTSWDLYKMPPTFIAGLALGYLFLRIGLYAAIMLHFAVDFLTIPIEVTGSLGVTLILGILTLVWIAVGACYFYYYAARALGFVFKKELWPPRVLRPKPTMFVPLAHAPTGGGPGTIGPSTPYGNTGFRFTCKYCGGTEARYKDGEFYCLNCGRKN